MNEFLSNYIIYMCVYIYMYIYIIIERQTAAAAAVAAAASRPGRKVYICSKKRQTYILKRCSYIQKMRLNHIQSPQSSIYSIYYTKHTKNIKMHFRQSIFFHKSIFSDKSSSLNSAFFADVHGPPSAGLTF